MKINRSSIDFKSSNLRKWLILILSFRLLPIIQSTYLDNQSTDLSTLESMQNDIQNRDLFLNHINQLNSNYDNRFHNIENQQYKRHESKSSSNNEKPIFLKRISLLSNIFGNSDSEDEKKIDKVDNQTESKNIENSELKKENTTIIDDLNKNLNQSNFDNQFTLLKNHLQNDKEIDTLNTIINFNKNYENWQDQFKNHHSFNRQDLINFLNLNNTTNNTNEQSKSKNLAIYSPESFTASKSTLYDNNQFGFKPNNFLSSLLVNNNEHDYFSRYNNANNNEKITEASDLNSEYDEDSKDNNDDDENKQINNRNGQNNKKRKIIRNRYRQNVQHFKQKNKLRKTFDDQYSRNVQNTGFRPVDKLLKEQSQQISSASTGNLKRNSINRNENNSAKTTKRLNNSVVNSTTTSIPSTTTATNEQEYNQLSVSNQPFKLKQNVYRLPKNHYGKRLINEILNGHTNIRKNLISSNNNKNVIINTATTNPVSIDNTTDQLEDDNNEAGKEEINEQDKQLVTDKTKELYEKNDELNDLQANDYETTVNKDIDLKNNDLINPQNQQIDTTTQINQQNQLTNQPEIDSIENDTIENENDLNNSMNSLFKNETNKESDLDIMSKTKFLIDELNKSSKHDKFKTKQQNFKKSNLEKVVNSNYKYYKIYDKYSKLNGFNSNFNFDSNYPSNSYLSNENFKINLNNNNGKSELDEITASNLIPYPNMQYNKQNSFNNLYYPLIKKKPYFSNYPSTFSTNPLNSMLFDKLNMPIDTYSPIDKIPLPPPLPIIKNIDKSPLENKFYNLDSKLHNLNSKYSLNSLAPPPPPPPFALPHHLDTKYYEPKGGHYDSKYHSIGNWQSGLAGFLLGVVPFSMLMASMVPTISAISSGGAAAAALGRRRRSIDDEKSFSLNKNENRTENFDEMTKLNGNTDCLLRLSKIIESINTLIKEKNTLKKDKANIYFNQLIELQKECIFNFSLPVDFYQELRKFLNFKNFKIDKNDKKGRDSYYAYEFGDKTSNLLNSVLNFVINLIINKGTEIFTQSRIDQKSKPDYIVNQYDDYHPLNSEKEQFSIFQLREVRCLQEVFCKLVLSKNFKKSVFSNLTTVLANVIPEKLAEKYGLDVLQNGLKLNKCVIQKSYC